MQQLVTINSGGSRIFPGGGGRQLPKLLLFFTFLPKTAWKWKNLDPPGGGASLAPPLGSANDKVFFFSTLTMFAVAFFDQQITLKVYNRNISRWHLFFFNTVFIDKCKYLWKVWERWHYFLMVQEVIYIEFYGIWNVSELITFVVQFPKTHGWLYFKMHSQLLCLWGKTTKYVSVIEFQLLSINCGIPPQTTHIHPICKNANYMLTKWNQEH